MHRFALKSYQDSGRLAAMKKEHLRIVQALRNRSKRAAAAAVRSHLNHVLRRAEGEAGDL